MDGLEQQMLNNLFSIMLWAEVKIRCKHGKTPDIPNSRLKVKGHVVID